MWAACTPGPHSSPLITQQQVKWRRSKGKSGSALGVLQLHLLPMSNQGCPRPACSRWRRGDPKAESPICACSHPARHRRYQANETCPLRWISWWAAPRLPSIVEHRAIPSSAWGAARMSTEGWQSNEQDSGLCKHTLHAALLAAARSAHELATTGSAGPTAAQARAWMPARLARERGMN
jgi:hypothetical protein